MTNPGAALQALRRRTPKVCPKCNITYPGLKQQVYCTRRCEQAAAQRLRRQRASGK